LPTFNERKFDETSLPFLPASRFLETRAHIGGSRLSTIPLRYLRNKCHLYCILPSNLLHMGQAPFCTLHIRRSM
jgi:hypothetical protein